jgi:hypothetical protein
MAYRDALTECPRERMPLQWAMTQSNLGNALQALGLCKRQSSSNCWRGVAFTPNVDGRRSAPESVVGVTANPSVAIRRPRVAPAVSKT